MIVPELLQQVLIALAMGALIGIERERYKERKYAGVRTIMLLSMAGPLAARLSGILSTPLPSLIYLTTGVVFSVFVIYIRIRMAREDIGLTTSAAVFLATFAALLVGYSMYFEAVAVSIIATFLLAEGKAIHSYVDELTTDEIVDGLKLGAMAFILYPLLPSEPLTRFGLINPRSILLFVILVLLVRFTAFIASKKISEDKGLPLAGLLGGGVSSLAAVGALAKAGRGRGYLKPAVLGIVLASLAMVIRNIFIASVSTLQILDFLIAPGLLVLMVAVAYSLVIFKNLDGDTVEELSDVFRSPLSLKPALRLGFYFLVITMAGSLVQGLFGPQALWVVALLGGVISSAAVAISAASMLGTQTVTPYTGSLMVILACVSSIAVKIVLTGLSGNRDLFVKSLPVLVLMILAGIVPFLL